MNEQEREKTKAIPIDGRYPELAQEIRRLLGWSDSERAFLSSRGAERKTGINHATIANMARGVRPSVETLAKFSESFDDVDFAHLLKLANYIEKLPMPPGDSIKVKSREELKAILAESSLPFKELPNGDIVIEREGD